MRSKKYYENIYPEILGETFEKQEIIKISKKFLWNNQEWITVPITDTEIIILGHHLWQLPNWKLNSSINLK